MQKRKPGQPHKGWKAAARKSKEMHMNVTPIRAPQKPVPGSLRIARYEERNRHMSFRQYQVDQYRGDGFGWDPVSPHATYREAVAAKRRQLRLNAKQRP